MICKNIDLRIKSLEYELFLNFNKFDYLIDKQKYNIIKKLVYLISLKTTINNKQKLINNSIPFFGKKRHYIKKATYLKELPGIQKSSW